MIFRQDAGSTLEVSGGLPTRRYEVGPRSMPTSNSGFNSASAFKESASRSCARLLHWAVLHACFTGEPLSLAAPWQKTLTVTAKSLLQIPR